MGEGRAHRVAPGPSVPGPSRGPGAPTPAEAPGSHGAGQAVPSPIFTSLRPSTTAASRVGYGHRRLTPSGIAPLDERTGGLHAPGAYLYVGTAGPAKTVALLHFVHAGLEAGERVVLLTDEEAGPTLDAAAEWGFRLRGAWESGQLLMVGFSDGFETRVAASQAPAEVMAELGGLLPPDTCRIAVDPGAVFVADSGPTALASAFLRWAGRSRATVCATIESGRNALGMAPPAWTLPLIDGAVVFEPRGGTLRQARLLPCVPAPDAVLDPVTLSLERGRGLRRPRGLPARRRDDPVERDPDRLLVVSLDEARGAEVERWADDTFDTRTLRDPLDAVSVLQHDAGYGAVLVHAPRHRVRDAFRACRALRPQTRAGIVFASHDGIRASDRIALLEAGCDDTISGGIAFGELERRVRLAASQGRSLIRPAPVGTEGSRGGIVDGAALAEEVRRLAQSGSRTDAFSLLHFVPDVAGQEEELQRRLTREIRDDDGDRIALVDEAVLVLLRGARAHQAEAFLRRFRSRLGEDGGGTGFAVRFSSYPAEPQGITRLLGGLGAPLR